MIDVYLQRDQIWFHSWWILFSWLIHEWFSEMFLFHCAEPCGVLPQRATRVHCGTSARHAAASGLRPARLQELQQDALLPNHRELQPRAGYTHTPETVKRLRPSGVKCLDEEISFFKVMRVCRAGKPLLKFWSDEWNNNQEDDVVYI